MAPIKTEKQTTVRLWRARTYPSSVDQQLLNQDEDVEIYPIRMANNNIIII